MHCRSGVKCNLKLSFILRNSIHSSFKYPSSIHDSNAPQMKTLQSKQGEIKKSKLKLKNRSPTYRCRWHTKQLCNFVAGYPRFSLFVPPNSVDYREFTVTIWMQLFWSYYLFHPYWKTWNKSTQSKQQM